MQPLLASSLPFVPALLALGVLLVLVCGGQRMTEADAGAAPTHTPPPLTVGFPEGGYTPPSSEEQQRARASYEAFHNSPEEKARRKRQAQEHLEEFLEIYVPAVDRIRGKLFPEPSSEARAFDVFGEIVALMPESQRHPTGLLEAAKQARAAVAAFDATAPKVETPAS